MSFTHLFLSFNLQFPIRLYLLLSIYQVTLPPYLVSPTCLGSSLLRFLSILSYMPLLLSFNLQCPILHYILWSIYPVTPPSYPMSLNSPLFFPIYPSFYRVFYPFTSSLQPTVNYSFVSSLIHLSSYPSFLSSNPHSPPFFPPNFSFLRVFYLFTSSLQPTVPYLSTYSISSFIRLSSHPSSLFSILQLPPFYHNPSCHRVFYPFTYSLQPTVPYLSSYSLCVTFLSSNATFRISH